MAVLSREQPIQPAAQLSISRDGESSLSLLFAQVVNLEELQGMDKLGVPFFGMNLGVALSVNIPGFRTEVAAGLLRNLSHGASSMMGAMSMEEVKQVQPRLIEALPPLFPHALVCGTALFPYLNCIHSCTCMVPSWAI